ncbi:MAG: metal-dependent hydrolase [Chitinophagaceae bacterium]|nr:metal-dependent hydrolase [Chitinophagaceae bacterium]
MYITYYGHSCFSARINNKQVLFDPFITPNGLANTIVDVDKIVADYILVSHAHYDHMADCIRIAGRTGAKVLGNWEISEWLQKQGVTNTHAMNIGGKWNFDEFSVKSVVAHHSSSFSDGSYGGNPLGFIITSSEGNFYYSGDTSLTLDMQLIPRWAKLNFAVLSIGDNFTMDAADAAECSRMIDCKTIIGAHYDTFGFIKIDHQKAKKAFEAVDAELHLLKIGETRKF